MSIRQVLGTWALLCASVAWQPAMDARALERPAPKESLTLPVKITPEGGKPLSAQCVVRFGPALPISALAFSPDGKTLAVGGYQEVLLWDLPGAKLAKRVGSGQLDGMVHAVTFLHGGKALAAGDGVPHRSGSVKIFDVETGEVTATLDEPQRVVCCLAASPDGKLLVAGDAGSLVHVWDSAGNELVRSIDAHTGWVLGVSFSGDGKRMATAGADQTLRIWDTGTWESILRYDVPAAVNGAATSPDGKTVVGAVGGQSEWALRIGRIDTDIQQAARRRPNPRAVSTQAGMPLDITWVGKTGNVLVACHDNTLRTYQGVNGRLATTFRGHTDWVYSVACTADGTRAASGSADGTVKLWKIAGGQPLATLVQLAPGTDQWLIVTPQGHYAASSADAIRWKQANSPGPTQEMPGGYHNPELVGKALTAGNTATK